MSRSAHMQWFKDRGNMEHSTVNFNGLHLQTLAKVARLLNSPTNSEFAAYIWNLSNSATLPLEIATDFMEAAGYEPFSGFPLKRKGEK